MEWNGPKRAEFSDRTRMCGPWTAAIAGFPQFCRPFFFLRNYEPVMEWIGKEAPHYWLQFAYRVWDDSER